MNNFKDVETMRYWCQKVLPLVYDDSLSYYELLNKVVKKLNDLIDNNKQLPDYIQNLIEQYISSGAIGDVVREILSNFMLNVKNPPNDLTPAKGDGSIDDTEAIQGCINYANKNGGMCVYFPSGVYLTQPLEVKENVSMFGFDRYNTRLVLKGGATKSLLSGTVKEMSISGMTLDGNMDIQVNNINLIDMNVDDMLLNNMILTDGYTLLNLTVNKILQIDTVIFNYSVIKHMLLKGEGSVSGSNIYMHDISTLKGECLLELQNSNSNFNNMFALGDTPLGYKIIGSNNFISGIIKNATTPYIDNGSNNTIKSLGVTETVKMTGDYRLSAKNVDETVTNTKKINALDIVLNSSNPLSYKEPIVIDEYFKSVPFKYGETPYNVLVNGEKGVGGLLSKISEDINNEAIERETEDNLIKESIVSEIRNREDAINEINANLSTEIQDRIDSYSELLQKVTDETNARISADDVITVNIENIDTKIELETQTRISEINELKNNFINVKNFGAKGDGVTDDSISINNCIKYALENGVRCVIFPTGTYIISSPLPDINKALYLFGIGEPLIRSTYIGTAPLIRFQGTNDEPVTGGARNLRIESTTTHSSAIIQCKYYNSLKFENIIGYYGAYGLQLVSSPNSFGCFLTNSNFSSQQKYAIYTLSDTELSGVVADFFMSNVIIYGSLLCGMEIESMSGLYCVNTDIISCEKACVLSGYFGDVTSLYFTNTLFDTSNSNNLHIMGQNNHQMDNIRFTNCWFSNSQTSYGADISKAKYISFVGCSFIVNFKSGMYCVDSSYLSMSNCNFIANSKSNEVGCVLYNDSYSTISNNMFGGYYSGVYTEFRQTYGLNVDKCNNCIVSNNVLNDNINDGMPPHENTNTKIYGNIGLNDEGVKYENVKEINGNTTFSGDDSTLTFEITHGLGKTPSYFYVTPTSLESSKEHYVTVDETKITVIYTVAPTIGENNITFNWLVG